MHTLYNLLRLEYEHEKETYRQQTELMGIARKVKRGIAWYPLNVGRSYYNSLNQLVVEVFRTEDSDIEHNFEYGRPVCFFTQNLEGKVKFLSFTATVSYADEERMVVVIPSTDALVELQAADSTAMLPQALTTLPPPDFPGSIPVKKKLSTRYCGLKM